MSNLKPIHQLINFLNLPPNQSSFNILNNIKSTHKKQFTIYYLPINNQYLLIFTYNHFKTLSQPITTYLTYYPTLTSLINSI